MTRKSLMIPWKLIKWELFWIPQMGNFLLLLGKERSKGLKILTWHRIFENRWFTTNMISKAFSWQKIAKLGKPLLLLCIWARGGGSCKYGNFQHFCSKTLSGNAFFNVIGSTMDANVIITTNKHST